MARDKKKERNKKRVLESKKKQKVKSYKMDAVQRRNQEEKRVSASDAQQCDLCQKQIAGHSFHFKRHMNLKHPSTNYCCPHCPKWFVQRKKMKEHAQIKHGSSGNTHGRGRAADSKKESSHRSPRPRDNPSPHNKRHRRQELREQSSSSESSSDTEPSSGSGSQISSSNSSSSAEDGDVSSSSDSDSDDFYQNKPHSSAARFINFECDVKRKKSRKHAKRSDKTKKKSRRHRKRSPTLGGFIVPPGQTSDEDSSGEQEPSYQDFLNVQRAHQQQQNPNSVTERRVSHSKTRLVDYSDSDSSGDGSRQRTKESQIRHKKQKAGEALPTIVVIETDSDSTIPHEREKNTAAERERIKQLTATSDKPQSAMVLGPKLEDMHSADPMAAVPDDYSNIEMLHSIHGQDRDDDMLSNAHDAPNVIDAGRTSAGGAGDDESAHEPATEPNDTAQTDSGPDSDDSANSERSESGSPDPSDPMADSKESEEEYLAAYENEIGDYTNATRRRFELNFAVHQGQRWPNLAFFQNALLHILEFMKRHNLRRVAVIAQYGALLQSLLNQLYRYFYPSNQTNFLSRRFEITAEGDGVQKLLETLRTINWNEFMKNMAPENIAMENEVFLSKSGPVSDRNLIGWKAFAGLSTIDSYFACLVVFFKAQKAKRPMRYEFVPTVFRAAKALRAEAVRLIAPESLTRHSKNNQGAKIFNVQKISQLLSDLWHVNILVFYLNDREMVPTKYDIKGNFLFWPALKLAYCEDSKTFCVVRDLAKFCKKAKCEHCDRWFNNKQAKYKHIKNKRCPRLQFNEKFPEGTEHDYNVTPYEDYLTENVFNPGKVLPKPETIAERLERAGVVVSTGCEFNTEFFATADIETMLMPLPHKRLEGEDELADATRKRRNIKLCYVQHHIPIAISILSNLGGSFSQTRCFVGLDGSSEFIFEFCKFAYKLADENKQRVEDRYENVFRELIEYQREYEQMGFKGKAKQTQNLIDDLRKEAGIFTMFFFNADFDLNCLLRHGLAYYLSELDGGKMPKSIKHGNGYICVRSQRLRFLDILRFCPGKMSLVEYLNTYGIDDKNSKWSFPYELVQTNKDLQLHLPVTYNGFGSFLSQGNVLELPYKRFQELRAQGLSEQECLQTMRRTTVPDTGEVVYKQLCEFWERKNMTRLWHYLACYCSIDVLGMVPAIQNQKDLFFKVTKIPMMAFNTLPSLAFGWSLRMMAQYEDTGLNFFVRLEKRAFDLLNSHVFGGCSNVRNRLAIAGYTKIRCHEIAPEQQQTIESISYRDFNCLYGSTCKMQCPVLGRYVIREREKNFACESVQEKDIFALTWLEYEARFVHKKHIRTILDPAGERTLVVKGFKKCKLDGFLATGENNKGQVVGMSFEFHGSVVHSHPSVMTKQAFDKGLNPINHRPNKEVYADTVQRDKLIAAHPLIVQHHVKWRHEWDQELREDNFKMQFALNVMKKLMPDPVESTFGWERCLELIELGKLHGIVRCSLSVPPEKLDTFKLMPPFFKHRDIMADQLCASEHAYGAKYGLLNKKPIQKGALCNDLSVQNTCVSTDMLRFYTKELGLSCDDISLLCQFTGEGVPFKKFMELCIELRESARQGVNPALGKTAKLFLNGFYGSSILKAESRRSILYMMYDNMKNEFYRTDFIDALPSGPTQDPDCMLEITRRKHKVAQNSPKQFGFWILNCSKTILLRFVYSILDKFLKPECWEILAIDTDSITIGHSGTDDDLRTICRPELKHEFEKIYPTVFVVKSEDTHTPLMVKSEKIGLIFLGVATKTYLLIGNDADPKLASKGISKKLPDNNDLLSPANFFKCVFDLYDKQPPMAVSRGIRCDQDRQMATYEQIKCGLHRFAPKNGYFCCGLCWHPIDLTKEQVKTLYKFHDHQCANARDAWNQIQNLAQRYPNMGLQGLPAFEDLNKEVQKEPKIPSGQEMIEFSDDSDDSGASQ